jgi:hypothetical protein
MGMFSRWMTTLAVFLLMAGAVRAQTTNNAISSTTASWVELAASARMEGLGEAFVAVADDVNALSVNPGGLGRLNSDQLSLTHDSYVQGADIEQGLAAFHLDTGYLAFGLTYGNFGSVQQYTVTGGVPVAAGTYEPSVWKADLGYGLPLMEDLYAGISGEFLLDNIYTNQLTGWDGSAGLLWTPKHTGWGIGLSLLNLGSLSGESIPTELRGGVSYKMDVKNEEHNHQTLLVSLDGLARTQDFSSNRAAVGLEYAYHDRLFLRAGQQIMDTTGLSGWSGLSVGVGLKIEKIQIDYAFATRGDLGNFNLISLASGF